MVAHQQKKLDEERAASEFRDRFNIPLTDEQVSQARAGQAGRRRAGDEIPAREAPGARRLSTARARTWRSRWRSRSCPRSAPCSKARAIARSPPPWPSCASSRSCSRTRTSARTSCPSFRTRRAPSAWKACSARSASTARRASSTRRSDSEQLMSYREDKKGQMLEEGINEAGSTCSWIAAGTAYANHGIHMVPFYIYYSMFGFQRVGDFYLGRRRPAHARLPAGRHRGPHHAGGRGPAAPGRAQPAACGHGAELRGLRPDLCLRARRDHSRRPAGACTPNDESVFYYIAVMNENYVQPALPKGVEEGILKGMYLLQSGGAGKVRVTLMGSGTILRECIAAAEILAKDFGIPSDIYSAPSFSRAAPRGAARSNAGTGCIRASRRACRTCTQALVQGHRPVHRGHRLHARLARHDPPVGSGPLRDAGHRWLRPFATGARRCASISKSTRRTSCTPRCRRWPKRAPSTRARCKAALDKLGLDPNKLDPQKA